MAAPEPAGVVAYGSMLVRDPFMGLAHERFAPEPAEEAALEAHHGHPMTIDEPEDDGASDSGGDTSGSDWGTRKSGRKSSKKRRKKFSGKRTSLPGAVPSRSLPPLPAAPSFPTAQSLLRKKPSSMDQAYGRQSHIDQHFRSFQDGGFPVLLHETKRDAPDAYTSTATLVDAPMARSRGEKMPKLIIPDGNFAQPGSAGGSPTKGPAVPLPNFLHTLKKRMPRLPLIPNNDPMQLTQMLQEFEFREQMRVCMIQAALKWAEEDFDGLQFMSKPDQVLERLWHHLPVEGRNICTAVLTPDSTLLATWLTEVARYHLPLSRWLEFRFPGTAVPDPALISISYPLDESHSIPQTPTENLSFGNLRRPSPPLTQLVPIRTMSPGTYATDSPLSPPVELFKDQDIIIGTVHRSSQSLSRLVEAATADDDRGDGEGGGRAAGWELFTAYSMKDLERYEKERWN